jgi:CRISPR-associated protein Csb2
MWLSDEEPIVDWNWLPCNGDEEQHMRVPEAGTLTYLQKSFNEAAILGYSELNEAIATAKGKDQRRLKEELSKRFPNGQPVSARPVLTSWQTYSKTFVRDSKALIIDGPFDSDILIFSPRSAGPGEDDSSRLGLAATLQITSALRDAAMKSAVAAPEWLSGHRPDGTPSIDPHVAFFPLPFIDAPHADGHIMGLAMAIPRALAAYEDRSTALRRVLQPLLFDKSGNERTISLWRGNAWKWHVQREKRDYPPFNLRPSTWTGPGSEWASVTPVVLHHYPKQNRAGDVERIVLEAFESAGLPVPVDLRVQPVSHFRGAGHARSLPSFTEGGEKMCRYQTHVVATFASPVRGPVLVGRGRFRGYGLFRPVIRRAS